MPDKAEGQHLLDIPEKDLDRPPPCEGSEQRIGSNVLRAGDPKTHERLGFGDYFIKQDSAFSVFFVVRFFLIVIVKELLLCRAYFA